MTRSLPLSGTQKINAAGAIAKLEPNKGYDAACAEIGAFTGIGTANPGDVVRMVGRTSGLVHGKVTALGVTEPVAGIRQMAGAVTFGGLVACVGADGKALSKAGDSGAPVVNDKNELLGMIYAGGPGGSYFIPIAPVLQALKVELVTK